MALTALGTNSNILFGNYHFTAVGTVVSGDSVTPPELTGDTPVADVFHPMEVNLLKSFGNELCFAGLYAVNCRACKGFHLNEPLHRNTGLNSCTATVASTNVMSVGLDFNKETALFKVFYDCFSALVTVHTLIFLACKLIHMSCVVHYIDNGKVVAKTYFKVVGVVGRSNLNNTCTKLHVNIAVGNNRNFSAN